MQSLSSEAHPHSQLCTVCTNISTRPLSFAQMEEHINGRSHLHSLRMASLSHCTYDRRSNTGLVQGDQHLGFRPIMVMQSILLHFTYWQKQSKSSSHIALVEVAYPQIFILQRRLLLSRALLWQFLLARPREQISRGFLPLFHSRTPPLKL
jgi:hypothetical protein